MASSKKSALKILHVSSAKTWRGGEQQISYLFEGLNKKGIDQAIFCIENSELATHAQKKNWPVFTYHKKSSINPSVAKRLKKVCSENGFSIVHLHDSHAHTFGVMSQALFGLKLPMVLHRRVDFPISKSFLSKWKYNHSSIKKIICVSGEIKNILSRDIENTSKISVVHSGIDLERFQTDASQILRHEYQIPTDHFIVANIASIAPHKDYFTFVNTAEILIEKNQSIKFLIIGGDGGEKEAIVNYIARKKLQSYFVLTGFRKDMSKIIKEIDLLLFTSKTEGLGTSILDCLCAGVPIVATKAGGIPEMITHNKNGILASVGDSQALANGVLNLINDKALRDRYALAGQSTAKQFSKENMVQKVGTIYQTIANI